MVETIFPKLDQTLQVVIIFQGLIFGSILLKGLNKNHHLFYLGLLVVFYSLDSFNLILESSSIFFHINLTVIISSLLYIYVQKLPELNVKKVNMNSLYIAVVIIITEFTFYLLQYLNKIIYLNSIYYHLFDFFSVLFSLTYIYISYNFLRKRKNQLNNEILKIEYEEARWVFGFLKTLLYTLIVFILIAFFFFLLELYSKVNSIWFDFISTFLDVFFIYLITIFGLKHKYSKVIFKRNFISKSKSLNEAYDKGDIKEFLKVVDNLTVYLNKSKAYKTYDFSITSASIAINVHTKKISKSISVIKSQNFNHFINSFRVEESKKLLNEESMSNITIEGIGNMSGFKSKSVFYKEFKNVTGVTPYQYRKSLN